MNQTKDAESFYELHDIKASDLPIIFHHDYVYLAQHGVAAHWHPNIELLFFTSGRAQVSINSELFTVQTGDIILFNSNCIHSLTAQSESCSYYCLIFDRHFCADYDFDYSNVRFETQPQEGEIKGAFQQLISEMSQPKEQYHRQLVKSLGLTLMGQLYRYARLSEQPTHSPNNSKIEISKKAIDFISQNYQKPLTIELICEQIGISKYYFCRIFKEVTGQTVNQYLNAFRCERAQVLLDKPDSLVSESAYESGYRDLSYFSKCYKKHFGYLPSEERKN